MKKFRDIMVALCAAGAFCGFMIFLIDLAGFDRLPKMCSVWSTLYTERADTARGAVLMSYSDILGVLLSLAICELCVLWLFTRYKYCVLFALAIGIVLFCLVGNKFLCFV